VSEGERVGRRAVAGGARGFESTNAGSRAAWQPWQKWAWLQQAGMLIALGRGRVSQCEEHRSANPDERLHKTCQQQTNQRRCAGEIACSPAHGGVVGPASPSCSEPPTA
jgi:hypothetical protein